MTNKTALKPHVEPGEYPCVWLLPSPADGGVVRVHGFVTLEGGRPAQGHAFGPDVPLDGEFFPHTASYPSVRCELSTGQMATFVNAAVSTWFPERARITGTVVLAGLTTPADESAKVASVRVQVTALDAITGTAPLERTILIPRAPGERYRYELGAREGARLIWEDESVEVVYDFAASSAVADLFRVDHRFSPHVTIDLDDPIPIIDFCDRWIDPLRWLIGVATGQKQDVTVMTATGEDVSHEDGTWAVYASGITQLPYNSDEEAVREAHSALRLGPDNDSLLGLLRRWMELSDDLHPIIHSFGRQVGTLGSLTPQAAFQSLIQAIEGTYRVENPDTIAKSIASHQAKRTEVIELLRGAGAPSKLRSYAKSSMGSFPPGSLNDSLLWVDSVVPGSFAEAVEPLTLVQQAMAGGGTWADGLRLLRNDLAHGNKAFPGSEVRQVVHVLQRFCTSLALFLLGSSSHSQERATKPKD